jgi:hypothetical protein
MPRKKRGHKRAAPGRASRAGEKDKQQECVRRVVQQIDQMMAAGVDAKQSAIELMRYPRQRMPVGLLAGGEGPHEIGGAEPAGHMGIAHDVLLVVELDKRMMRNGPVKRRRAERERQADQGEIPPHGWLGRPGTVDAVGPVRI